MSEIIFFLDYSFRSYNLALYTFPYSLVVSFILGLKCSIFSKEIKNLESISIIELYIFKNISYNFG